MPGMTITRERTILLTAQGIRAIQIVTVDSRTGESHTKIVELPYRIENPNKDQNNGRPNYHSG